MTAIWRIPLADLTVVGVAVALAALLMPLDWVLTLAMIAVATVVACRADPAPRRVIIIMVAVLVIGGVRQQRQFDQLVPHTVGGYQGWVRVIDDPQPYVASTRMIVEIDGQRFEVWVRGRASQQRLASWRGGQYWYVAGSRSTLKPERLARVRWQHVVGEFELEWVGDLGVARPLDRASNRVRQAIERASEQLPTPDGALYRGLVVGDDGDQPTAMIERFRASGLSHLTAVSGQNVSYVLLAASPVLRRLRPFGRWLLTAGLVLWFVSLTRYEPSIVRAGTMAILSATAFAQGNDRAPLRLLCLAVVSLLLIDPLLVDSIGFWLSVGATAGVVVVGPWLTDRGRWMGIFATPIAITVGAQVGVVIPAMLAFGQLPLVAVPANLLAVPVAGTVMLYGLPAGLIAGWVEPLAPVVMFPCRVGVRWVDAVSHIAVAVEPSPTLGAIGWLALSTLIAAVAVVSEYRRRNGHEKGAVETQIGPPSTRRANSTRNPNPHLDGGTERDRC